MGRPVIWRWISGGFICRGQVAVAFERIRITMDEWTGICLWAPILLLVPLAIDLLNGL